MLRKKINNKNKPGMMLGYINKNGDITGVEPSWHMTPLVLAELLKDRYQNRDAAVALVESAVLLPIFKKGDYEGVEGFGGVLESHISFYDENLRAHVGHLFLFMKSAWHYSNNGIDWDPITEVFVDGNDMACEKLDRQLRYRQNNIEKGMTDGGLIEKMNFYLKHEKERIKNVR